jgi:dienelactone hydrolase
MRTFRAVTAALALLAIVWFGARSARPFLHGLSFVIRAADMGGAVRRAADVDTEPAHERILTIQTSHGRLRGRMYEPVRMERVLLLTSGLHPAGIDEPRLVALARQLSASGLGVFTPDIQQLSQFAITPAITDQIEAAAVWLADHVAGDRDRRIGLMGISFSGGLSVVAAGRPSLRDRTAYVLSFGGHDDLPRVLRYLCTGIDGAEHRQPHDYGVAVILLGVAERAVPAPQVAPLRAAVRRFLWASHLDRVDKPQADREFAALRALAGTLPEPSATLLRDVNDRNVADLGPRLLPYIRFYGGAPALSPDRSPMPSAPVFVLHGIDDNVIPEVESEALARDLHGHAPTRLLLSGLISHAEADQPVHAVDVVKLASVWGDVLAR